MDHHQLVHDCLRGDAVAQRQLYNEFAGPMLGVCYRYTKSITDAEDVLQEGFIMAFRNLHQFSFSGELGGWIRRIMVNTAINYLKKNSRYQTDLSFREGELHPVSDDDPEVTMSTKELAELIRQLPPGYQTIFNLHAIEGYSHVEIGRILGIKEGTSRSQYARSRALLITWINKFSTAKKMNRAMHDPKFEQEVQRRMHDLEFIPSDSVWAGIQQGIAPRERRRAVAILWWLFPGMLLLAGGIVMYRHSGSRHAVAAAVPAARSGKSAGGVENGVAGSGSGGGGNAVAASGAGGAGNGIEGTRVGEKGIGAEGNGGRNTVGKTIDAVGAQGAGRERQSARAIVDMAAASGEEGALAVSGEEGALAARRASLERYQPGLIGGMASRKGVHAPALNWRAVNTAVSGIEAPRHPWSAGFAAGGGAAGIHSATGNALASMSQATGYFSANPQPLTLMSNISSAGGSKQNKAEVKVDYSYWAGIYGEKQLSARWSVDIGLNLHYYSVRFQTNNPVNAYAPTSASLFASTTVTYALGSGNVNPNDGVQTYDNRYYFLEVPVTAQWKLNHSRSLPLFWRGGAVLSYLMSSNGLYYDNSSGTYKRDNGVVRRAQAGINSGLMVGLPVRGVQVQAGPELQYALTSMLTTGSGGGHLFYGGMRVALMK